MSVVATIVVGLLALLLAVVLAYLPLRLMIHAVAKNATAAVRAWVQRQRDRRQGKRRSPDRRQGE